MGKDILLCFVFDIAYPNKDKVIDIFISSQLKKYFGIGQYFPLFIIRNTIPVSKNVCSHLCAYVEGMYFWT